MTSSHHGPYVQGCKRPTMARTEGSKPAKASQSQKARPSPDCGLQFARMKSESLVIADQHAAVNMFLSLVHTPVKPRKPGVPEARDPTARRERSTVSPVTGTKS